MKKVFLVLLTFLIGSGFGVLVMSGNFFSNPALALTPGVDAPPASCFETSSLPASNNWKSSPWDTTFLIPPAGNLFTSFVDVNGDGLADYVYSQSSISNRNSCTYINTGTGWNLAFRCIATQSQGIWTFKGDCAV